MKQYLLLICFVFVVATPFLFGQTSAPSSAEQLTTQLQQSPGDQALREKIIALALTLNPKPATPDAVSMAEGAAEYAFKNAKANSDYSDAAKQYEKALMLAPWLADDYFNCGVAHEKAGENKEAIRNFNLYLLGAPNANDAQAIKKRIGGLQYAAQKAEDEANSPEAKLEKFIKTLDGGVWKCAQFSVVYANRSHPEQDSLDCGRNYIAISGRTLSFYALNNVFFKDHTMEVMTIVPYDPNAKPFWTATVTGQKVNQPAEARTGFVSFSNEVTISDDGQSMTRELRTVLDDNRRASETEDFVRIK